ncbi:YhdH/YhfP family quinone oxidoreductase [Cetobacterium sp. SF1]|uniref:YhdH/YhfP family quinone oxidoreductase n=1 Tax=unclassified Cetobacterium TaxID=2630983 RepID=UPI003CFAFB5D
MEKKFKCFLVKEVEGKFVREIVEREIKDLPENEILIEVKYSSLNYKDGLSASGNRGVTRKFPHVPGIDAAGIIVDGGNSEFKTGEEVIVTGFDLGMNTDGGFSKYIRVPKEWVLKLPKGLTLKEAMIYGTAGFTAALSVYKLVVKGEVACGDGEILVTGATGGVGSIAVGILHKLGYTVVAGTGKKSETELLNKFGASRIINRNELDDRTRPVLKGIWAGAIDTVGGNILSTVIKSTKYDGVVTACGNVAGAEFESSVYPFILRGVTLYGVDSVECKMELRKKVWNLMGNEWKIENLSDFVEEISLEEVNSKIEMILKGENKGRTIIKL